MDAGLINYKFVNWSKRELSIYFFTNVEELANYMTWLAEPMITLVQCISKHLDSNRYKNCFTQKTNKLTVF